jgi:hypothetical protein
MEDRARSYFGGRIDPLIEKFCSGQRPIHFIRSEDAILEAEQKSLFAVHCAKESLEV